MWDFNNISFQGTFRDYQQKVLDNISKHIKDNKIHIVAAPGSGKTILGLEIIKRLNSPTIIFSPTLTIRQQWGERFKEKFLKENQDLNDYFSFNLMDIRLITSVTYQSLHAALNKEIETINDELYEYHQEMDYSKFDLIETIKNYNIKTICLDEAHHLRNDWQKSLEKFVSSLSDDIKIISLTATPPYDSSPSEWKRYIELCGEIDEEIFVPELVKQGTLCPHQDYIYFNYPTDSELNQLKKYKLTVYETIEEISNGDAFKILIQNLYKNYREQEEYIVEHAKEYIALLCLANFSNHNIPKRLIKLVSPSGQLPRFKLKYAETAFQFIIDNSERFIPSISNDIEHQLKSKGLIERRKVKFILNNKLNRLLISSIGKLKSIEDITESEYLALGKELRLVILTDHIKASMVKYIGTDNMPNTIGIVSIFERIRKRLGSEVHLGILSGSLIIVPNNTIDNIIKLSEIEGIQYSSYSIPNTNYSEIKFKGKNKNKVKIITQLFEKGYINILIGTKSLLGEGWDSPCINCLILASFVGSFVLSNQMRGRAIRTDKNTPNKTANIWHLVTIEPISIINKSIKTRLFSYFLEDKDKIVSYDFETLERRFDAFLGPAYYSEVIESGIERIEAIKPPFDKEGIKKINEEMLRLANNRKGMKQSWFYTLNANTNYEVIETSEIPPKTWPKKFVFVNLLNEAYLGISLSILLNSFLRAPLKEHSTLNILLYLGLMFFVFYLMVKAFKKILYFLSPHKTIQTLGDCIYYTLRDIGKIQSIKSRVKIEANKTGSIIECSLEKATFREKRVFAEAMKELLTSIENPRYLIIKKGIFGLSYSLSFACPSVIGVNKENAKIFQGYIEKVAGNMKVVYTRNMVGRKILLKCRRWSYINRNESFIYNKKKMNKWE